MLTLYEYLKDPCGTLSIPYHKNKGITIPPNMMIVHDRNFSPDMLENYTDEPYFRLKHDLKSIPCTTCPGFSVRTADENDIALISDIINRSYDDLSITENRLSSMRSSAVFDKDLWIIVIDDAADRPIACGIAELDNEAREGILEWIQVVPEYRGRGVGSLIVRELIKRISKKADFATVSGKVRDIYPEKLYRKCGFAGNDIWHILRQK
ncbi:MAG: GNAT family N-acetyltransferase [Clostridia bacterium]|nr:GNAT family N-acetyltransferase [Clostridia bacterium]MBQ5813625.1 GNAT family N-acetyltransferase [Clostridia bacterium]